MARLGDTISTPQRYTFVFHPGKTYSRSFEYDNPDNTPINLTGKSISLHIKDVFPSELILLTNGAPSPLGSFFVITDAINGKFYLQISADETASITGENKGHWWMDLHEGDIITPMGIDVAKSVIM